jgi:Ser/Thr protein kinase RdoA (MazF antagonist)
MEREEMREAVEGFKEERDLKERKKSKLEKFGVVRFFFNTEWSRTRSVTNMVRD